MTVIFDRFALLQSNGQTIFGRPVQEDFGVDIPLHACGPSHCLENKLKKRGFVRGDPMIKA
jgi:hypothetical protein